MTPVPLDEPGVYIISTNEDVTDGTAPGAIRLSPAAVAALVAGAPNPTVLRAVATASDISARLAACWFVEEPIVYIGLASTSVRRRISQFYKTPIGARRPHAGGWFLKMLAADVRLWVHVAATPMPAAAETALLDAFGERLTPSSRRVAVDPDLPIPFANLERAKGQRKRHGIGGVIVRRPVGPTP